MHRSDHRETHAHVLAGRLNTGWLMIEAEPNPTKKEKLEDHWLRLLRQYEVACDVAPENRCGTQPVFSDLLKEAEGRASA